MRVSRAADCRTMPWKNGGGETTEIVVSPPGASLETFDWRLSRALVASDGPFSAFAGVDRILAVLDGDGLRLTIDGAPPVELTSGSTPLAFDGGASIECALLGSPVRDLNLMLRRGRCAGTMTVHRDVAAMTLDPSPDLMLVHCLHGTVGVSGVVLAAGDTLVREPGDPEPHALRGDGAVAIVTVSDVSHRIG